MLTSSARLRASRSHPATDLVDRPAGQGDHMKRVKDGGGVGELVIDRVLVATQRIQRGDLDPSLEHLAALVEPRLVHGPRTSRDQIHEPGVDASVLVTSHVDHPGEFLGAALAGADVMPQVLIHPEGGDPGEAGLVGGGAGEDRLDAGPHGPPRGG
jgi:hypothetical protein